LIPGALSRSWSDVGGSALAEETLRKPIPETLERRPAPGPQKSAAGAKIAPDRVARAAKLFDSRSAPPPSSASRTIAAASSA
jgi:hypothetical protein